MTKKHRKEIFKSLFEKHYPRLCAIAVGYISNKDDAEDIVQELFITAWNKELEALPEKEFAAYMTTAVKNGSLSFLRKKSERMVSIEDHPGMEENLRKRCWRRLWPRCPRNARKFFLWQNLKE